jgi:hypothetical protein
LDRCTWLLRYTLRLMLADVHSSVVASIIKIVVSFEISSGGLAANVDEDCEFSCLLNTCILMSLLTLLRVTVSTILYWCMIETGLANIASNLPLFRGLLKDTSLNCIIISIVRSSISLSSRQGSPDKDSKVEEHDDKSPQSV